MTSRTAVLNDCEPAEPRAAIYTQLGAFQVIPGLRQALLLMRPADKWRLWLKSELAYGGASKGAHICRDPLFSRVFSLFSSRTLFLEPLRCTNQAISQSALTSMYVSH